jgi:para-nitrobenzyl esterase
MVWLHGGGFAEESGGAPAYDGYNLAKAGNVVVVTLNHRLNIFGYTYLAEQADERFATSGNVGQLDLVAALEWVRDNVEHFGGDPGNVTIFGESGGGAKVSALIAMPAAAGLFHKAIVQSGSDLHVAEPARATEVAKKVYRFFGLKPGDTNALQNLPTNKLLAACGELTKGGMEDILQFWPVVDGHSIPRQTWTPRAPTYARQIPMIIGTTAEEAAGFCGSDLPGADSDDASLSKHAAKCAILSDVPAESYAKFLPIYRRTMPNLSNAQLVVRMGTDAGMWRNAILQATRKIEVGGPPVFMYEFAWKTLFQGGVWATHGVDLNFVFGHPDFPKGFDDNDLPEKRAAADPQGLRYRLATQTMEAWAAFARTGNPSTSTLEWPAYDLQVRSTMIFDGTSRIVNDPRRIIRESMVATRESTAVQRVAAKTVEGSFALRRASA